MVLLSGYFVLVMLAGLFFYWRKRLERMRWLLWLLVVSIPLPIVASELGWVAAEVGRQPWIVHGLLRTSAGVSPVVSLREVAATLAIFAVIYLLLFLAWLRIFTRLVARGPDEPRLETAAAAWPQTRPPRREEGEMNLQLAWYVLIAVLLAGYAVLDGFDLGIGVLYPYLTRDKGERAALRSRHRTGMGRQRGVAGDRRRRALRRLPAGLRDGLQRLLHGHHAGARSASSCAPWRSSSAPATTIAPPCGTSPSTSAACCRRCCWGSPWATSSAACR